jgi:hypothetical protein
MKHAKMPSQLKTVLSYIQTSSFPSAGKLIKEISFFDVKSIIFLKSFVVHSCEKKKSWLYTLYRNLISYVTKQ